MKLIAVITALGLALAGYALAGTSPTTVPIGSGSVTSSVSGPGTTAPDPNTPSLNELYLRQQLLEQRVARLEYCHRHPHLKRCKQL